MFGVEFVVMTLVVVVVVVVVGLKMRLLVALELTLAQGIYFHSITQGSHNSEKHNTEVGKGKHQKSMDLHTEKRERRKVEKKRIRRDEPERQKGKKNWRRKIRNWRTGIK
jgi:hypothetical protein